MCVCYAVCVFAMLCVCLLCCVCVCYAVCVFAMLCVCLPHNVQGNESCVRADYRSDSGRILCGNEALLH